MRISLENYLYVDFFGVQSALSDYVGLVLNYLIIQGLSSPRLKSSQTIRFLKLDFVSLTHSLLEILPKNAF